MPTPNDDGGLRFGLLGPLEVRSAGARVPLGGRQQRAILACLLLESGGAVTVDRLADALWPERLPAGYLTTLQTYVFHLRELLEPTRRKGAPGRVLVTVPGGGYRLEVPRESVDATRFEDLASRGRAALDGGDLEGAARLLSESLALWRGEVLADLPDLGFVDAFARRLSEVRLAATEDWVDAELALGRHASLVPELGRLVGRNPLRERLQAQRMLALYRSSRQAEALAAYRETRDLLDDELGVDPGPALQSLHEQMLRQDPDLAPRHADLVRERHGPQADVSAGGAAAKAVAGPTSSPLAAPVSQGVLLPRWRRRGRARLASLGVIALAVGLIGAGTYRVASSGSVTPLPPNSVGALTLAGLSGDAVQMGASPVALTEAGGSVWVVNQTQQSVVRIDPQNRRIIQTVHDVGQSPEAIASSGKDLWVAAANDGFLTRINVAENKVVAKIPVGILPAAVIATADDVWVANSGDNTVQHVDPGTGRADPAIPVGDGPDGLALDGSTLWVANGRSGSLTQIDTRTGQ
ncbi:MAG: winged helix-turn-helix domain-containing protein, partial [Actinomycetota bacterium]|nr:winged helix-turn-helix domain-containing protein [Actinomycetota bacterium]